MWKARFFGLKKTIRDKFKASDRNEREKEETNEPRKEGRNGR